MQEVYFYDCNLTIGINSKPNLFMPEDKDTVKTLLKKVNVKKAVTCHAAQFSLSAKAGNNTLVSEIKNDDFFAPAVAVAPNASDEFMSIKDLDQFINKNNVKLATMIPKTSLFSASKWQMGETYSYLEQKGLPLLLSFSEITADGLYEILSNYKKLNVILKDTGFSNDKTIYRLLELFENLYIETGTYTTCGGVEHITEKFGAKRLVFGSGLSYAAPGASVAKVLCSDISDEDKIKIAHKNFENLIKEEV